MRAIQVTCPNCGANLRVADDAKTVVTCEYCGVASAIQRRSRILERVLPPPPQPARREIDADQLHAAMRLAVQKRSRALGWIVVLVFVLPTIAILLIVWGVTHAIERSTHKAITNATGTSPSPAPAYVRPEDRPPTWQGKDWILTGDVDGDGTLELIGRGRQVNRGDIVRVIALDLATGKQRWQSEPIGTYTDTYRGPLVLDGDLVLFASEKAEIQAFSLRDGTRRWRAQLDERVKAFCASKEPGQLLVATADNKLRPLARADGTAGAPTPITRKRGPREYPEPPPCDVLADDDVTPWERTHDTGAASTKFGTLGLHVDAALPLGDGGTLVTGARKEGTRVTTLVALDASGAERWRATGAADALAAEGAPRYVVAGDREACFVYYSNEYRLACLSLADGKRLWDIEAPSFFHGILLLGRSLVLTTARDLEVYDLDRGTLRWKLD